MLVVFLKKARLTAASLLLAALGFSLPTPTLGQVTRVDSAAVLLRAGQTFQSEGRWKVAEAIYQYILEQYGGTPAATAAWEVLEAAPEEGFSRSTQVELMVWATTFGAWMGVAIPAAFGADGPEAYGGGLLLGGPAGFLGARAYSRSRPLTAGQVRAITFGSLWGTWQGYGLMELLGLGEKERCNLDYCYVEDPDGETVMKALVAGGLVGTLGGALIARKPISQGLATTVSLGAFWGSWFGVAGGVLGDLEGDDLLASTVLIGDAGLLTTAFLAPQWDLSRSRARLISIAGVIGGLAGAGLDLIVQPDDDKVAIGIPLVGSLVGLVAGAGLTSEMDKPGRALPPELGDGESLTEPGSSLLEVRNGRLGFGFPTPFPTLVPVETDQGFNYKPALGVTLFSSRF